MPISSQRNVDRSVICIAIITETKRKNIKIERERYMNWSLWNSIQHVKFTTAKNTERKAFSFAERIRITREQTNQLSSTQLPLQKINVSVSLIKNLLQNQFSYCVVIRNHFATPAVKMHFWINTFFQVQITTFIQRSHQNVQFQVQTQDSCYLSLTHWLWCRTVVGK